MTLTNTCFKMQQDVPRSQLRVNLSSVRKGIWWVASTITMLVSLFHEISSVTRSMRLERYLRRAGIGEDALSLFHTVQTGCEHSTHGGCVSLIIARVLVVTGDLKLVELFSFKTISRRGRTNYTDLRPTVTDLLQLPLMCRIRATSISNWNNMLKCM